MRGINTKSRFSKNISLIDRLIASSSYLSMGLIGFIWLILCYVRKTTPKPYIRFNCYQSILFSLVVYLGATIAQILAAFLAFIPILGQFFTYIIFYIFQFQIFLAYSIAQWIFMGIVFYLAASAFIGKNPELPWLSKQVKYI